MEREKEMATTRFPKGVTNAVQNTTLAAMGQPDPTKFHTWFDDFDNFEADQWVITTVELGLSSATEATSDEDGGVLVITNDGADDDSDFLQWSGDDASGVTETFKLESGKKTWFKSRFKVSSAAQSAFIIGLQITDTTPLNVTDGVFFQGSDGSTNLDFHVEKDNSATNANGIHAMANDTYVTVGFYYDGADEVQYFVDDAKLGSLATTNLPDDEELTISFGIENGEADAKSMSVDYIFVAKER